MKRQVSVTSLLQRVPKLLVLGIILLGTMLLDALAYGLFNSCASCTTYFQFITTPAAVSAPIIASISSIITLTNKHK